MCDSEYGIKKIKCPSVYVSSRGSRPDFGPAKAAGRSQTRPVEGIGPRESHVVLR